jgi:hypothetical protein
MIGARCHVERTDGPRFRARVVFGSKDEGFVRKDGKFLFSDFLRVWYEDWFAFFESSEGFHLTEQ